MNDQWVKPLPDGRSVTYTCKELLAGLCLITAQVSGSAVMHTQQVPCPSGRAEVEELLRNDLGGS
jgi:hypothetical protein